MTKVILIILILALPVTALGIDSLSVKSTFPIGWKYSTDGRNFHVVGASASGLKTLVANDSLALKLLNKYSLEQQVAVVSLTYGLILGGVMVGKVATSKWHGSTDLVVSISAGAAILLGSILESASSNHLKAAVERYNAPLRKEPMQIKVCLSPGPSCSGFAAGLILQF